MTAAAGDRARASVTVRRLELAASGALAGLTLAAVVGLQRLFDGTGFLAPTLVVAVLVHALATTGRRLGWGTGATAALALLGGVGAIALSRYGRVVPPSWPSDLVARLGADLREAWRLFGSEGAPAPVAPGFVVVAMAGTAVVAVVADALAFRARAPVEAAAPATGLFLFGTVLAGPSHRVTSAVLFVLALLLHLLAQRALGAARAGRWVPSHLGRGSGALGRAGAWSAVACVAAALLVAPVLPGWGAPGVVDLDEDGGGDGRRVTVSPLVDIRARLVDQSDEVAFVVDAERAAYWRLTALDEFDGRIWRGTGRFVDVDTALPPVDDAGDDAGTDNRQRFAIDGLASIWLPAAAVPRRATVEDDESAQWDSSTGTLVADATRETSAGLRYVVESGPATPEQDLDTGPLTTLPADFSPTARATARRIVRGADTDLEKARALQDHFRQGFRYSVDVEPGHGSTAVDTFLERRVGYCEQFAATYAAMAREVGLPARVAVGFTQGDENPARPGRYVVRGRHAHAWPEVLLADRGWVAFEPTPGRGAPGAQALTGVAPAQATPPTAEEPAPAVEADDPAGAQEPSDPAPALDAAIDGGDDAGDGGRPWFWPVGALVAVAALYAAGVHLAAAARRRSVRRASGRVAASWARAEDALARVALAPRPHETPVGFARRAAPALGGAAPAHLDLARAVTRERWGPHPADREPAPDHRAEARTVVAAARRLAGPLRWASRGLDPRRARRRRG